jgi:hypothetical protein
MDFEDASDVAGITMAREKIFSDPKDLEISDLHRRYVAAMEERLPSISEQTKSHYLTVLASLIKMLETPGKPLSEVVSEVMAEAAPLLFIAMQR